MNGRSPVSSSDEGDDSLCEPDADGPDANSCDKCHKHGKGDEGHRSVGLKSRPSSARRGHHQGTVGWERDRGPLGQNGSSPCHAIAPIALGKMATTSATRTRRRASTPCVSPLVLIAASLGIMLLVVIINSLVGHQRETKGCRMSYMRPSYHHYSNFDTEHTRFATKYSLYLYREQGLDERKLRGIPTLFIPGNAGSYKQVRPIAAEAAQYYYETLQHDENLRRGNVRSLDFFTVDFNEDITAFHGQTLLDQAEYLNEAVRFILSLYADPQQAERDSHLPDPTSVLILGHSMGGLVARAMLIQPNYQPSSINTIITMSAPHARPPVTFDGQIVRIYDHINDYWRRSYAQKWANDNPLWHVTLISIAGGSLDTVVPSDYANLESLVPETHGFTVFTTGIPTVWTSMDHQAILWCDQFRKVVARALFDVVDVSRPCQTRPRADRMRLLKRRFLPGMEASTEKLLPAEQAATLLTLGENSSRLVPTGSRLALSRLGPPPKTFAHLLPIPPQDYAQRKRFTLLTNVSFSAIDETAPLQVLLCSVFPVQSSSANSHFPSHVDLSGSSKALTKFACKNAASDVVVLPPSTATARHPFEADETLEKLPFSYLQYDLDNMAEHQFVAILDRATTPLEAFVVAEFSDEEASRRTHTASLAHILTFGASVTLPANRPLVNEVRVPALASALLAFKLRVSRPKCAVAGSLFAPFMRQHLDRPYESKYFVNVRQASIAFHGIAPYLPPPLEAREEAGLGFQLWSDPGCEGPLEITLSADFWDSMGLLYMRYRTAFAAFPLLIVAVVLRKQFAVYDTTGVFISFTEGLDLSLRRSIPLLLLSLTLLSIVLGGASLVGSGLSPWAKTYARPSAAATFHRNELLIGAEDPFFCFLVPLIGLVCIGVCAALHYAMLGLTWALGSVYGLVCCMTPAGTEQQQQQQPPRRPSRRASLPDFAPSTPRRRIVSTAVLLFLVSTFIPYQFAYLVACLVQLFTTARASRHRSLATRISSAKYHHYTHSILLLMTWVLPINLPILAVWIRNLAVHWLTPFSSHHNVIAVMPFIILVENHTAGRMVPQAPSWMRHITSFLLFATAFCVGVFGVSHAYVLHHLVSMVAAWLAFLHYTSHSWSLQSLSGHLESIFGESRKRGKTP